VEIDGLVKLTLLQHPVARFPLPVGAVGAHIHVENCRADTNEPDVETQLGGLEHGQIRGPVDAVVVEVHQLTLQMEALATEAPLRRDMDVPFGRPLILVTELDPRALPMKRPVAPRETDAVEFVLVVLVRLHPEDGEGREQHRHRHCETEQTSHPARALIISATDFDSSSLWSLAGTPRGTETTK
jgi:hypothetical protein